MRYLTSTMLFLALAGCGETGDTTMTDSSPTTSTTTTATDSDPTTTGTTTTTTGETTGTGSASEGTTAAETTEGPATTAGTSSTTSGSTTAVDTSTTGETTGQTTGQTTSESTGDTGGTPLVIAIVDAYLVADCMPAIEPDPVMGNWYVEFDNTGNPNDTSAVVVSASLSLADADPPVIEPIVVQPLKSPPLTAGDYVSQEMIKLTGMAHSACDHCDEFYALVLEYDENGVKHLVQEDVTISCVF